MVVANRKDTKSEMKKVSKRQKLKAGPNPSNTWPQQPKIKSMAARDKAYIRMAGLGKTKNSSNAVKEKLNPDDDVINSPEFKFGRLLASPVARTRHATILKLKEYLKARTNPGNENGGLSVLDLMKLWKGLWHTLYLCDGVSVQEEVSKVLAGLIWSVGGSLEEDEYAGRFYLDLDENVMADDIVKSDKGEENDDDDIMQIIEMSDEDDEAANSKGEKEEFDDDDDDDDDDEITNPAEEENTKHCRGAHLSALYIRTYFRTLNREWSKMDKYRIDKFYTLTRFVLREIYRYMASRHWNLGIIRLFNDAIFEEILRVQIYGNGVKFHLLDICLDELALVNSEKETGLPLTEATFLDCMEPYFAMAQRVAENIVHERVMEKVISRFLDEYSIVSDNYSNEDSDEKKKLVMDQVHVQTVAQFLFELASDGETEDKYRKQLYDMHKTYMKRVKLIGRDVDLDGNEEEEEDNSNKEGDDDVISTKAACEQDDSSNQDNIPNDENTLSVTPVEAKKTKKKKKDKKKSVAQTDESQEGSEHSEKVQMKKEDEELVVTISTDEQKEAAKAVLKSNRKNKDKKRSKGSDKKAVKTPKKVKFDKVNRSKSFKASMKDLKKLDAKKTLKRTPEKSILMTKKERKYKS